MRNAPVPQMADNDTVTLVNGDDEVAMFFKLASQLRVATDQHEIDECLYELAQIAGKTSSSLLVSRCAWVRMGHTGFHKRFADTLRKTVTALLLGASLLSGPTFATAERGTPPPAFAYVGPAVDEGFDDLDGLDERFA